MKWYTFGNEPYENSAMKMAPTFDLLYAGLAAAMLLSSCGGQQEIGEEENVDSLLVPAGETEILSVGGRLFSIPSPVQAALMIKESGLSYRKDLTAPMDQVENATGKVAQATMMGVLGADLAYVTVHQDGQRAMATLQAIEKLGGKLELTNAFDRNLLDRFRSNLNDQDSLLRFSSRAFRAADRYLKNDQREDVSTLILAGGWIESMYLMLSDPAILNDQASIDRIGDQKASLHALIELLANTDMDRSAGPITDAMRELSREFDAVERTYTYESPVTDAQNRVTYINSTSTVEMPEGTLDAIRDRVTHIRSLIIA